MQQQVEEVIQVNRVMCLCSAGKFSSVQFSSVLHLPLSSTSCLLSAYRTHFITATQSPRKCGHDHRPFLLQILRSIPPPNIESRSSVFSPPKFGEFQLYFVSIEIIVYFWNKHSLERLDSWWTGWL